MNNLKIQIGNAEELVAWTDGPGWLTMDQGDQEISIHFVQALALAEFILANKAEMQEAYKRHIKGKSNGRGD